MSLIETAAAPATRAQSDRSTMNISVGLLNVFGEALNAQQAGHTKS
jgi:hypothetical protein